MNELWLHALNCRSVAAGIEYGAGPKLWVEKLESAADEIDRLQARADKFESFVRAYLTEEGAAMEGTYLVEYAKEILGLPPLENEK